MAAPERRLDVWIVDLNTVYKDVPFSVVTDWLVQGRLLAEDRVRISGKEKWHAITAVPALQPYLPKPEPFAAEDHAEALEPIDLEDAPVHVVEEEDEDVDMIPLIDISLVLLIFFMMTASVSSGLLSPIQTPAAQHQLQTPSQDSYWVGIETKDRTGNESRDDKGRPRPWYSLGIDREELVEPTLKIDDVTASLQQALAPREGELKVRLRADKTFPIEIIRSATAELQGLEIRLNRGRAASKQIRFTILGDVSEIK